MFLCTRVLQNTAHKQLPEAHSFTTLNNTRVPSLQFSRSRQVWVAVRFRISKALRLGPIFLFDFDVFIGIITCQRHNFLQLHILRSLSLLFTMFLIT